MAVEPKLQNPLIVGYCDIHYVLNFYEQEPTGFASPENE